MPKEIYIDENGTERILSSSPSALSGLLDTDITTPSANQVLAYDGSKWGNVYIGSLWQSLGNLSNGGTAINISNYTEVLFVPLIYDQYRYNSFIFTKDILSLNNTYLAVLNANSDGFHGQITYSSGSINFTWGAGTWNASSVKIQVYAR